MDLSKQGVIAFMTVYDRVSGEPVIVHGVNFDTNMILGAYEGRKPREIWAWDLLVEKPQRPIL